MERTSIAEELRDEDFIVRIRPTYDEDDGSGDGGIDISIMAFAGNPLDDEGYSNVMHFTKMVCSSVPIMEASKEIRDIINEYVISNVDNDTEIDVELEDKLGVEKEYDGNVVHLTFNTKTGGSA